MYEIFVNYRTCDEPFAALLIEKRLADCFGSEQVFRDSRSIRLGTHFPAEISRALRECRALVAVIGERWLRDDRDGQRLIDDPMDYVRLEIAEALRRDILVVPVLVGDAGVPAAAELPADIAALASRQYLNLGVRSAEYDIARLIDELMSLLATVGLRADRAEPPRHRALSSSPSRRRSGGGAWNAFYGTVDARHSVFGNVYYAR